MIDEKLDSITHDLAYESYDCATVSGIDQVVQNVKIRLLFIRGEWFRDVRKGVPYFENEFTKGDKDVVDSFIKAEIIETPEVRNLLSYTSTFDAETRTYSIEFSVDTIYGAATDTLILGG
jgi:hypothetical protein